MPNMKTLDSMSSKQDLAADWGDMLSHQIRNLEAFEYYWAKLPAVFQWIYQEV